VTRPLSSPVIFERLHVAVLAELKERQIRVSENEDIRVFCRSHVRLQPGSGALFLNDIEVRLSGAHPGVADTLIATARVPTLANTALPAAIGIPFTLVFAFAVTPIALPIGFLMIAGIGWMTKAGARLWLEELLHSIERRVLV
jgi:hypothetical protein